MVLAIALSSMVVFYLSKVEIFVKEIGIGAHMILCHSYHHPRPLDLFTTHEGQSQHDGVPILLTDKDKFSIFRSTRREFLST